MTFSLDRIRTGSVDPAELPGSSTRRDEVHPSTRGHAPPPWGRALRSSSPSAQLQSERGWTCAGAAQTGRRFTDKAPPPIIKKKPFPLTTNNVQTDTTTDPPTEKVKVKHGGVEEAASVLLVLVVGGFRLLRRSLGCVSALIGRLCGVWLRLRWGLVCLRLCGLSAVDGGERYGRLRGAENSAGETVRGVQAGNGHQSRTGRTGTRRNPAATQTEQNPNRTKHP